MVLRIGDIKKVPGLICPVKHLFLVNEKSFYVLTAGKSSDFRISCLIWPENVGILSLSVHFAAFLQFSLHGEKFVKSSACSLNSR